jgi:hypothetical protein
MDDRAAPRIAARRHQAVSDATSMLAEVSQPKAKGHGGASKLPEQSHMEALSCEAAGSLAESVLTFACVGPTATTLLTHHW